MEKLLPELLPFLQTQHELMVTQLHQFCEINSGTGNLAGLNKMHQALKQVFSPLADTIEDSTLPLISTIDMAGNTIPLHSGHLLFVRKRPHLTRRILLSGHMDTVYPKHHPFQTLTYLHDNHLNGPGVADMKGGLVVMLHALAAFEQTPYAPFLGWDVIINADEEIGSPVSGAFLSEIAQNYQAALVYEPSVTPKGTLAKNRKGSGKLTLIANGKTAHAGRAFDDGRNAICYLAEIISAVHALNGQRDGVTLNVGKIAGGEAINIVPDKAVAKLDIRISRPDDEAWVWQQINGIANRIQRDGCSLTIDGCFGRPVKRINPLTQSLFNRVKQLGKYLGLTLDWQDSGGCCDGNNLALHGLPVLDTMGVRGGDIHTSNEYILLDSLVERAALSALLLIDFAREDKSNDEDDSSKCSR